MSSLGPRITHAGDGTPLIDGRPPRTGSERLEVDDHRRRCEHCNPHLQRPPREEALAKLTRMLEAGTAYGYASGSIGTTMRESEGAFDYEVSYKIVRRADARR